jgi:ATP-dependent RNA helicase RhlE
MSFTTFGLHPDLLRGVEAMGFTAPTPIQAQAVPPRSPAATCSPAR